MSDPIQALRALELHLQQQHEHGVERVFLSPKAIADLGSLRAAVAAVAPATSMTPPEIPSQIPREPQAPPPSDPAPPSSATTPKTAAPEPAAAATAAPGEVEKRAPLRRNVSQEEVGKASVFLLSDLASGVTGQTLYVDCGISILGL